MAKAKADYGFVFADTHALGWPEFEEGGHTGLDFIWAAAPNKIVHVLVGGKVVAQGTGEIFGYDKYRTWVLIKQDDGLYGFYAHLAKVNSRFKNGKRVQVGDELGLASNMWTHYSVMKEKFERNSLINPKPYLNLRRQRFERVFDEYWKLIRYRPSFARADNIVDAMERGTYSWTLLDRYLKKSSRYKKLHPKNPK